MSADDPKTLGECWKIFDRTGLKVVVVGDNTFHNARKVLELENKAKIESITTAELVSELRKRDGVEVLDAFVKWQREPPNKILIPSIDTEIRTYHCGMKVTAIVLRITE